MGFSHNDREILSSGLVEVCGHFGETNYYVPGVGGSITYKDMIRIGNWIYLLPLKPQQIAISLPQLSLPRSLSLHV
jgi:hypothetical protein